MISYLLMKNKNEQFQTETYKLFTLLLLYSFIIVKLGCKYYSLYYKPNVIKCKSFTELTIPQNFYLISTLFALSCNNFISFYLSIELSLVSFIGLLFISYLPTLIFMGRDGEPKLYRGSADLNALFEFTKKQVMEN